MGTIATMIASGETEDLQVTTKIYNWIKERAEDIKSYHLQGGFSTADKF
jgi:hypothetical protein